LGTKKERVSEWILLKDIIGRDVGKALVEFEPKEQVMQPAQQMPSIISTTGQDIDIHDVVEVMKDSLAELMWDTSHMFNDFRRQFLPDFYNFDLGIMDSPFMVDIVEVPRRPTRHHRHHRTRDIARHQHAQQGLHQETKPEEKEMRPEGKEVPSNLTVPEPKTRETPMQSQTEEPKKSESEKLEKEGKMDMEKERPEVEIKDEISK